MKMSSTSFIIAYDDEIELEALFNSIQREGAKYRAWVSRGAPPDEVAPGTKAATGTSIIPSSATIHAKTALDMLPPPPQATRRAPAPPVSPSKSSVPIGRPVLRLATRHPIKGHID
ncbi:hypothetical protein FRC11_002773 [Ceratobasidium sp. 423]|nr:hypothetical protein FRC11_002773 [Ceratobasidium sp. 423]